MLNMFRTLIYPSPGACDYSVELPHWSYCSWFYVCWSFGVVGLEWYPCCSRASACNTDTTPTQPHRNSNTHRTKNSTTNVVIQQNSRKLLMMDILMSETCWAHKWKKMASDIKLVFYSSTKEKPFGATSEIITAFWKEKGLEWWNAFPTAYILVQSSYPVLKLAGWRSGARRRKRETLVLVWWHEMSVKNTTAKHSGR